MSRKPTLGQMRERVAVQAMTPTHEGGGSHTEAYATAATIWAQVEEVTGSEALRAGMPAERRAYRVRWRDGAATVTAKHLFNWRSTNLHIESIAQVGVNRSHREALCFSKPDGAA